MTWIPALLLLAASGAPARAIEPGGLALGPGGLEAKLRLEAALEAKVDRLLEEAFGPRSARVFIEATLEQSVTEETIERLEHGEADLPGFHKPASARRFSSEPAPLRRLSVRLVVDKGLGAARSGAAEQLVRKVLAVDPERGDEVSVVTAALRDPPKALLDDPRVRLAAGAAGALFALAVAFLMLAARAARRSAVLAVRQIREDHARLLAAPPGPVIDAVPALPATNGSIGLSFVTGRNLRLVARFLEHRGAGATRWVLATLEPDTAASLFRLLPAQSRQDAAVELARPQSARPPSEAELRNLTDELHDFVDRESRGPGLLQELLARSPESMRKAVLESVRLKAPAALQSVQAGLASFEDLERADAGSLAVLARETTSTELALALRGAPPALKHRLLASLPQVLRESAERRSSRPDDDPSGTLSARAAILSRWRDLEASGKVRPL